MPAQLSINPETGELVGRNTTDLYTADEIAAIRIPCPRCAAPATVDRLSARKFSADGAGRYYVGRIRHGCRCW